MPEPRIDGLLAARLFLAPQLWDDRIYFISNLSGRFSLYAMDVDGPVGAAEPLLPPNLAVQNPELMDGLSFYVFPGLDKILVAIDQDGDEKYQPMLIPRTGGFPEPAFPGLAGARVAFYPCDAERNIVYLLVSSDDDPIYRAYQGDLATGTLVPIGESPYVGFVAAASHDHTQAALLDFYTPGDEVLYLWRHADGGAAPPARTLLYGVPLDARAPGQDVPLNAIANVWFTSGDRGLLFMTSLFDDAYSLGYLDLAAPADIRPVPIAGIGHRGVGEMTNLDHLEGARYLLRYNIDGVSWAYEGRFDEQALAFQIDHVICGAGRLAGGVVEAVHYDKASDRFVLFFCTATSPTQIYTVSGPDRGTVVAHTRERVLGIPDAWLAPGEDASFVSHDGLRISARLYLPAAELGFTGPRPLVYYIHGGPQGQERPNFAWFSMPLIQFLTLQGFAVFVPNVRGSTGYGLAYMKHVDHDWGGQDRLDHVYAMEHVLPRDPRLDVRRAGVIGRSYGGYMTLTLATRHPELWAAAVDMFGPYDLPKFIERSPEGAKTYFYQAIGHPARDAAFLAERSPATYIADLTCPLLVIQGANDPRVREAESRNVVEHLRAAGKTVDFLVFANEGHDVIKYENKVRCYTTITDFFKTQLQPGAAAPPAELVGAAG